MLVAPESEHRPWCRPQLSGERGRATALMKSMSDQISMELDDAVTGSMAAHTHGPSREPLVKTIAVLSPNRTWFDPRAGVHPHV